VANSPQKYIPRRRRLAILITFRSAHACSHAEWRCTLDMAGVNLAPRSDPRLFSYSRDRSRSDRDRDVARSCLVPRLFQTVLFKSPAQIVAEASLMWSSFHNAEMAAKDGLTWWGSM
jgi:hypothetical protein